MQETPTEAPAPGPYPIRSPPRVVARGARRLVSSPRSVAATVLLVYGIWIGAVLAVHPSPYAFVNPGRAYVQSAEGSGTTLPAVPAAYGGTSTNPSLYGYDGQFTLYMALHPAGARNLVDVPWYRYQRILEPLLVRALSVGIPALIPWMMLFVSWMAAVLGTWAIASWLTARGRPAGWALLFGFWPGLIGTVRNDLTDGLAYALVALALLLLDSPKRSRPGLAALTMGLAVFARQEVAIYAVMMALGMAAGVLPQGMSGEARELLPLPARLRPAGRFLAVALVPFGVYLVFLAFWLRGMSSPISAPAVVPPAEILAGVVMLIAPAVVATGVLAPAWLSPRALVSPPPGWRTPGAWAWATYGVHVLALIGFMVVGRVGVYYSWSFSTVFRYYIPAALGAAICSAYTSDLTRRRRLVLVCCAVLPMVAFPVLMATGI